MSLAFPSLAGRFFTTSTTWEAQIYVYINIQIHIHCFFIFGNTLIHGLTSILPPFRDFVVNLGNQTSHIRLIWMGNECKYTNCIIGKLKICHMVVLNSFFFFLCKSLDKHIERAPVMGGFSGMVKTKPPYQLTLGTRLVRQKPVQC